MVESRLASGARGGRAGSRVGMIVGGAVILAVLGWLVYSSMEGSTAYYLTVSEVKAAGVSDRMVRVSGLVADETIDWDPQRTLLRFEIADQSGGLPVLYEGVRPDMLQDGTQAVVEGRYTDSGVFEATDVLVKCPSKYVEE